MKPIVKWMAEHPVAANLTMIMVILVGLFSATQVAQKTFPEFATDVAAVTVPYQGASPAEITQSIIQPIEDQLSSIDGIDEINANAREGSGTVTISFLKGENIAKKLDDVKTEIDRITVFPEGADEPTVVQRDNRNRALEISVHGDVSERVLKETAQRLKDELVALNGVSFAELSNDRDYEISIEIDRDTLTAYGLTLAQVGEIVRANSIELPGGDIEAGNLTVPLRTLGRNYTAEDFRNIVIRTSTDGAKVRLGDIATVIDGFEDVDIRGAFGSQQSVTVNVFRVGEEQVLNVVQTSLDYIDKTFRPSLPEGVEVSIWQNEATVLQSRMDLLVKNAFTGFALVMLCLALFLDVRLAFWSAIGIGVAFAGSFIIMGVMGLSINMISLFGFILAIGIVVDNAIVVSENIFTNGEQGKKPLEASVFGAQRVAVPVIFSALTTIVAFTPLLQLPAPLGSFLGDIPKIVIIVLSLSLLQSLLILPRNLSSLRIDKDYRPPLAFRPLNIVRAGVDRALKWFINGPLDLALRFATKRFLVPIAGVVAAMMLSVGLLAHGFVKFEFFPSIDGEYVTASLEMADGTSLTKTSAIAARIQRAAETAGEKLADEIDHQGGPIVENINVTLGRGVAGGPFGGTPATGSSVATAVVKVLRPEMRDWPTSRYEGVFVREIGEIAGMKSLTVSSSLVDAGDPISLELSVPDGEDVTPVVDDIRDKLRAIPGVFGI
ncbi:MAG: efflux RND transporter permease subunit [Pseudomonadota bacterium]